MKVANALGLVFEPRRWPLYPYLPLTRCIGAREQLGVLVDHEAVRCTVFLANLYDLAEHPLTVAQLKSLEHVEYETLQAVLRDGWRVD